MNKKEAIEFAQKLYDVKILSKKGKKTLINQIKGEQFQRSRPTSLKDGSVHVVYGLSKSGILSFVSDAFRKELTYRSGMMERSRVYEELGEQDLEYLGIRNEKIDSILEARLKTFEGFSIEESIEVEDSFPDGSWLVFPPLVNLKDEYGLISKERSVFGKTCTRTTNDLLKIGLIGTQLYFETLEKIKSNELYGEGYVVNYLTNEVSYQEDYEYAKNEEIDFAKGLHEAGIINKKNFDRLLDSYTPMELKRKYGLLEYCENAMRFELENSTLTGKVGYKKIFKAIEELIPDFNFSNFEITFDEKEVNYNFKKDSSITLEAIIEFTANDVIYKNRFYYYFFKKVELKDDVPMKISSNFYNGINKWLADKASPYRLYYANKNEVYETGSVYGEKEFWLILLTQDQFKAFGSMNSDYFLFEQNHDNFFNSKRIAEAVNQYADLRLFEHLSGEEKMLARQSVEEKKIEKFQDILSCFLRTITYIYWEDDNFENPYEELTKQFSLVSRGIFNPLNIEDNYGKDGRQGKDSTELSFEYNGKMYSKELKIRRDWLVTDLLEFIESVLTENNVDGKFYYCCENGEAAGYIFLTENQFKILSKNQKSLFKE